MPAAWPIAARGKVLTWLRPGQVAVIAVRQQVAEGVRHVRRHFQDTARWTEMEAELTRLRQENEGLATELAAARNNVRAAADRPRDDAREPLLRADCVEARVLGQQAVAYLSRRQLLDVGRQSGVQPNALVIARGQPAVVDCGRDHRLKPGQFVVSQARVWGQIVEVGAYTSVVRTVTEPGYRDLVWLAGPVAAVDDLHGPQGVLEGTGQAQVRIRLVPATAPVAVGDLVYTAADQGIQAEPLFYGRVVRVERSVGAAHWEIWMEPAVGAMEPQRVAVLRTELNPLRVADKTDDATGGGQH
jgi:cell shape-determining protein MreC